MSGEKITIQGKSVEVTTPEGVTVRISVAELMDCLAPGRMDTCGIVLPDKVKSIAPNRSLAVWVYQMPPRVMSLKWVAGDSAMPFGPGASYRTVRLAMPYVLVLAVFSQGNGQKLCLTHSNECFFMDRPLRSLDEQPCYPALLNCSKFSTEAGHPLSWICTARLNLKAINAIEDDSERLRAGFGALIDCLWNTGFNLSSEHHEETSWFSETVRRGVDTRVAGVEAWEAATLEDPMFALTVPWIPTGRSVRQIVDRILAGHGARRLARPRSQAASPSVAQLVRMILRQAQRGK